MSQQDAKRSLFAAGKKLRAEQDESPKGSPKWRALEKRIVAISNRLEGILAKELREERNKYLVGLGHKPEPSPLRKGRRR